MRIVLTDLVSNARSGDFYSNDFLQLLLHGLDPVRHLRCIETLLVGLLHSEGDLVEVDSDVAQVAAVQVQEVGDCIHNVGTLLPTGHPE